MNPKKILRDFFGDPEACRFIKRSEIVGDIAILSFSESIPELERTIADTLLQANSKIRLVAKQKGGHGGEFRTAELEILGGTGGLSTVHKEYGVQLQVNLREAYFSPRSNTERYRIAEQVREGERILVMFSGIGPLALMLGFHANALEIIGIEKNSGAHQYALKNLEINKKIENVSFLQGDVRQVMPGLDGKFNRIAMPLPLTGEMFLPLALERLGERGVLHYYSFQELGDFTAAAHAVDKACRVAGRKLMHAEIVRCGHVGPKKYRVCVDAQVY